jgi:hypothetical protein
MNAYTQLLNYLLLIISADIDINTVTEGEGLDRIDIANKNIYPLAHIDADDGTFTENNFQFNVSIQVIDQIDFNKIISTDKFTTNDNRQDVYNTSLQSLRRAYNELARNAVISVSGNSTFNKVRNQKNGLIGYQLDLLIEVPNDIMSICP